MPQQREVTHRFMIMRFRSGATSIAIIPRRSKPDGGARFGPADIGTLGDPCHR